MGVQPRDAAVDAAGRDDLVVDLKGGTELRHLLLPLPHWHDDDEIEDAKDQRERHELHPGRCRSALGRGRHGQHDGQAIKVPRAPSYLSLAPDRRPGAGGRDSHASGDHDHP